MSVEVEKQERSRLGRFVPILPNLYGWYEVEEADDGSSYIVMFVNAGYESRKKIGPMPLRFAADMRQAADDLCWAMNLARDVRLKICPTPEKLTAASATPK